MQDLLSVIDGGLEQLREVFVLGLILVTAAPNETSGRDERNMKGIWKRETWDSREEMRKYRINSVIVSKSCAVFEILMIGSSFRKC